MILWGNQDPLISLWQAERLHREIRGSRLEILDNCGHVPHEERPEDSAKLILDFLR
jgi:pimeloyl-ACP methyl ester carboxylesterase